MSVLVDLDDVRGVVVRRGVLIDENVTVGEAPPVRPARRARVKGETRRPPTRPRVVAGLRAVPEVRCAPVRRGVRWPWLAAMAVAAGAVVVGFGVLADAMAAPVPSHTAVVSVAPGETLWDVASRMAPSSDAEAVVERIRTLNNLDERGLVPGLPLEVPAETFATN
ncbi:LysM peptidoglycan-binding domain-containing protein [Amycolatopsis sp. 195334CR]|uniref:LysM peptidoglycan-binding domain-containing protein n=1 Tax=Amycolatopsis sp. 195334CR TaxID=2814588 RepID=UPI001A8C31E6|nr:LysM peptidoglycan-binding domain-containing protein [Amycolatopsis sp. 195334CR]MBN6041605.1 LysM peptidoglycan-binding domain-containing protein [Amycolatopsis sp. 195334CR]